MMVSSQARDLLEPILICAYKAIVQQFKDTPTRVDLSSYTQILGYNEDLDLDTASILQRT